MALAAGQTGHLADHQEGVYVVVHGATAGTARPTLGSASTAPTVVLWEGTVEPTNAVNGDVWWDETNSLLKVKVSGSFVASGSAAYAAADGLVEAYHDFTAAADGDLTEAGSTLDTGQPYLLKENIAGVGFTVSSGVLTHALSGSEAAAYAEVLLTSTCAKLWADFQLTSTTSESIVLISSATRFTDAGGFPEAGCHLVITRTGWSYEVVNDPFSTTVLDSGTFGTALSTATTYRIQVEFSGNTATITLPDGTVETVTDARIGDRIGAYATVELYSGSPGTHGVIHILEWGADVSASGVAARSVAFAGLKAATTHAPRLLYAKTLASSAATISIADIAAGFSRLRIELIGRMAGAGTSFAFAALRFNSDAGNNYDRQNIRGITTTADAVQALAGTEIGIGAFTPGGAAAGIVSSAIIDVYAYDDTNFWTVVDSSIAARKGNSAGDLRFDKIAGWWRSTAAVTGIQLLGGGDSFAAGTVVRLYGCP